MGSTSIIEESEFRLVPQGPGHPQSTVQNHQDKPAVLVVTHIYYFNEQNILCRGGACCHGLGTI